MKLFWFYNNRQKKKTICTSADRLSTNFSIAFWRLTRINKWQWNIFICQWNGLTLVSSWRRTQGGSIWWLVLGKPQRKKIRYWIWFFHFEKRILCSNLPIFPWQFLIPVVKPDRVLGVLTRSATSDAIVGIP